MRDGHLDPRPDRLAAIVLAGGRARRLGGVDKPMVAVGGVPMLGRVLRAVAEAGAAPIVVVGPERGGLPAGVRFVREEPAGGGPVAAAAAGVPLVGEDGLVALLAADLPFLDADGVRRLINALKERDGQERDGQERDGKEHDGAVFVDRDGQRQYLCGVWRVSAIREALRRVGDAGGRSMRALVAGLDVVEVRWGDDRPPYFDCDTADDLERAEQKAAEQQEDKG